MVKRRGFARIGLVGVVAALVMAACGGGAPAATTAPTASAAASVVATATPPPVVVKLKAASFGSISDAPFFIAQDKGYFKDEYLDVEFVPSQNAAQGITFLASGQVEVAGLAPTPGLFNAIADGIKVKIVADKGQIDARHSYVALVIRKQLYDAGTIKTVKDLKGKKVGVSGLETGTGAELHYTLQEAGLTINDITVVPGSPPDGYNGLKNGALDAAALQEPFLAQALADGSGQLVRVFGEVMPHGQNGIVAFGERMLNDKPLAARFMRAYLRGVAAFNAAFPDDKANAKGREEIVQILIKYTTVKNPALYDQVRMPLFPADASIDTKSIDKFQQFFIDQKLQKKFVPVSDYYQKIETK